MTRTTSIAISTKGLRSANRVGRRDFRFVNGSDVFICDRFQAMFVSPRIATLVENDSTIDEFVLEHADSQSFETLEHLICGETILASDKTFKPLVDLIDDLGNAELSEAVLNFVESETELNISNCISRLQKKMRLNVDADAELDFIARRIWDFEIESLRDIEIGVIEAILQRRSLRIPAEDWLLSFIFELGSMYYGLLRNVRFGFLSPESIDLFFSTVSIDDLDNQIWEQIRNRMRHRLLYDRKELLTSRFTEYVNRIPDSPWSGLLSHLRDLCCGNIHERGSVEITCSSNGHNHCWEVVNSDWNNYWRTNNSANSWIQFDFKEWVVALTHYSLKSGGDSGYHLLEWELSGSEDGKTWMVLDKHQTNDLNGNFITKIFPCKTEQSCEDFYRYIRLQQTGRNSSQTDCLSLANIEFFGLMMKSDNRWMSIAMA